jgi:Asp-tRNA(Asn)/Glu-tRNA(Gln) amidotransferase C subunit
MNKNYIPCSICSKTFASAKSLRSHINWHNPETYKNRNSTEGFKQGAKNSGESSKLKSSKLREKYLSNPNMCAHCNDILAFNQKNNKFCSSSCAASYNNIQRKPRSIESRNKTRESTKKFLTDNPESRKNRVTAPKRCKVLLLTCKCCSKNFYVRYKDKWRSCCSPECARTNSTYRKIIHKYEHKGKILFLESSWEVDIAVWLDENNIDWDRPNHIKWVDSTSKVRKYFPDFYLPEYDVYLDPKNPYIISKDREKIEAVSSTINLIYGKVEYIKNKLNELIHS